MYCSECKDESKVVWFLRHQKTDEEDTGTNANVITILCQNCGKNASVFIEDFLGTFFPDWDEEAELKKQLFSALGDSMPPLPEGEFDALPAEDDSSE